MRGGEETQAVARRAQGGEGRPEEEQVAERTGAEEENVQEAPPV